jgi:hypothetical protein
VTHDLQSRYGYYSHHELYAMLMDGSPDQVESLATTWSSMETTVDALAAALRCDLDRLLLGWDSAAGREFDRRAGLVVAYAHTLAEEFGAIHNGLVAMSGALTEAQSSAEDPDAADASSATVVLESLFGGIIGGQLGRELDPIEQDKARARMVNVVCTLATNYRITDYWTWPFQVPAPPPDTPGNHPGVFHGHPAAPIAAATAPPASVIQPAGKGSATEGELPDTADHPLPPLAPHQPVVVVDHAPKQPGDWWRGTGPAIAGAGGLVAAGGLVIISSVIRSRTKTNDASPAADGTATDTQPTHDGVVRQGLAMMGSTDPTAAPPGNPAAATTGTTAGATMGATVGAGGHGAIVDGRASPTSYSPSASPAPVSLPSESVGAGTMAAEEPDLSSQSTTRPDDHSWLAEGKLAWLDDGEDGV